jgi:putative ABC transport system substrate-binding protein
MIARREFVALIGAMVTAWPCVALTQERVRRVAILVGTARVGQNATGIEALLRRLQELGWAEGRTVRFDTRWSDSDSELMRMHAAELLALAPELVLVVSNPALAALRPQAGGVPVVFVMVADPVGSGFVPSLARPGGTVTGFTNFEPSMGGKWVEMLKAIAGHVTQVAVLIHPETAAHRSFWREAAAVAPMFGIDAVATPIHDAAEIERGVATLAAGVNGGLVVLPHTVTEVHQDLIVRLAARHKLPSVHAFRSHTVAGGLISYGVDGADHYTRAADYVDRILRGARPGELPVQAPLKFELVINLKTAQALGLTVPPALLARADEVIE